MTPEHLDLYRQLSETKIYKERFHYFTAGYKPPVFDSENETRCLWGMVDWDKISDKFISTDGQFLVMKRRGEELHSIVDRLDMALIKAILKQEET
jgi:hypothetical protein